MRRRGAGIDVLQHARGAGEAAREAITCGAFDSVQTSVNVADQEPIDLTLPLARAHGLGVIAKRPLANVA